MHAFTTKILGTLWPLFSFLNAFSKALIWHKAQGYVLKWFGSIALHKSLLEAKKNTSKSFCLILVHELYIYNKTCPHTHYPHPPLGEPELRKIGFVEPIFTTSEISKTVKMLSKDGTTNVITR